MVPVEERERIRRAYFIEGMSIREIARTFHHRRQLVREAIQSPGPGQYEMRKPRDAPVLGPYRSRIVELLEESERLPRKQRYTGRKIYELICTEGYTGSASTVRRCVAQWRKEHRPRQVFIPLEFDPGADAQVDWGEAQAMISGEQVVVQLFVMRLNYSRALFVMAFPAQKQEAFFEGHVQGFHFFSGVPHRITYDNLKGAVYRVLEGRNRQEQRSFIAFRSHYLFESFFCTPGQAHQKGGVEHAVGYARRNFLVPLPEVDSFEALNAHLLQSCREDMERRVKGQPLPIREALAAERPLLLPVPQRDYLCCATRAVTANPYSQVTYHTNRYSVPVSYAGRQLVLRAFPFRIEVLYLDQVIAAHPRCYGREQDVFDPLHYLPLLDQRPGAFDYARPIRRWREQWPPVYEDLLAHLRERWPENQAVREFVGVLNFHREHAPDRVAQAVRMALEYGCAHAAGVRLCLRQLLNPDLLPAALDLTEHPKLLSVGDQPVELACYDQLLGGG